jgi:hypothetical protein
MSRLAIAGQLPEALRQQLLSIADWPASYSMTISDGRYQRPQSAGETAQRSAAVLAEQMRLLCQGEGRGFEFRRPLQKVLLSVPFASGRFASAAHVPTELPTVRGLTRGLLDEWINPVRR